MGEQELHQEMERLRRELAQVREDRNNLHKMLCDMLPRDEVQWSEQQMQRLLNENATIEDLLVTGDQEILATANDVNDSLPNALHVVA